MACKGLPLITDEVCRCPEQAKISISQHFSGCVSHLILDHIGDHILRKVVLHHHYVSNNRFLAKRNSFFNGCEIHMQQLSWPTASQRPQWGHRQGGLKLLAPTAFSDVVSEVTGHTRPPESFLHERQGAALTLMGCLTMAPVKSRIPMDLRNNELKHCLLGLS